MTPFHLSKHRAARAAQAQSMEFIGRSEKVASSIVRLPCGHEQTLYTQSLLLGRSTKCKTCGARAPAPDYLALPHPVPLAELAAFESVNKTPKHLALKESLPHHSLTYAGYVPHRTEYAVVQRQICECTFIVGTSETDLAAAANKCPQCGDTHKTREAYLSQPPIPVKIGRPSGPAKDTPSTRIDAMEIKFTALAQAMQSAIEDLYAEIDTLKGKV